MKDGMQDVNTTAAVQCSAVQLAGAARLSVNSWLLLLLLAAAGCCWLLLLLLLAAAAAADDACSARS